MRESALGPRRLQTVWCSIRCALPSTIRLIITCGPQPRRRVLAEILALGGYEDNNRLLSQLDPPASCMAPSPSLIPMGEIYRLKASVPNPACAATRPQASVIIEGLRDYGMILDR